MSAPAARPLPTTVISARRGTFGVGLSELWAYRDLLLMLAMRDVRLRYKQTALGVVWVVLQPLAAALIFAAVFGRLAGVPTDGSPYVVFVFAGLLPWTLVSAVVQRAGNSLIADARLISKVYFPRLAIPLASTGAVLVDFLVSLAVMAVLLGVHDVAASPRLLAVPLFLLLGLMVGVGASLWVAALSVRYRDFTYAVPFLVQIWLFASPVVYASSLVQGRLGLLFSLNPLVGVIDGFRWALLGRADLDPASVALSAAVATALAATGALAFTRVERTLADEL